MNVFTVVPFSQVHSFLFAKARLVFSIFSTTCIALLKLELVLAVSTKSEAIFTLRSAQSLTIFNPCTMFFEYKYASQLFHSFTGSLKKDVSMFSSWKRYHESGPIKERSVEVESKTGKIGFPYMVPCLLSGQVDPELLSQAFK